MGQQHFLGMQRQQGADRLLECLGIELHRRGGRENKRSLGGGQRRIRKAKGVAGKNAVGLQIMHTEVMVRMTRRIVEHQRA